MMPPRGIGLKGLEWSYLTPKAQRHIVNRVSVAENNVVAKAEELVQLRLVGDERIASTLSHFQAEGRALGELVEAVYYLREMRVIDDGDLDDRPKRSSRRKPKLLEKRRKRGKR